MTPGDDRPVGDVPPAGYDERTYEEILAAGRPVAPDDDEAFRVSWGALFAVVLIFGGLGLLAVLMSNAARDEPLPVTAGPAHGAEPPPPAVPAVPFGPGEAPSPFRETGTGSRVFAAHRPDAGLVVVYVKVDRGRLVLSEVDEHDVRKSNLHIVDGPYEGATVIWGDSSMERLRVEATGTWTVELRSSRSAPVRRAPMTGTGPEVFWYEGPAGVAAVTSAATGPGPALLVNTYDDHRGPDLAAMLPRQGLERVRWPHGPVLVHVRAVGPWGIVVTPA